MDFIHKAVVIDAGQWNELLRTADVETCFQNEVLYRVEEAVGGQVTMGVVVEGEDRGGGADSKLKLLQIVPVHGSQAGDFGRQSDMKKKLFEAADTLFGVDLWCAESKHAHGGMVYDLGDVVAQAKGG